MSLPNCIDEVAATQSYCCETVASGWVKMNKWLCCYCLTKSSTWQSKELLTELKMIMIMIVSFGTDVPRLHRPCDGADDIMDGIGECKSRMCVCTRPLLKHIKQTDGFSQQCKLGITQSVYYTLSHSHSTSKLLWDCTTSQKRRVLTHSWGKFENLSHPIGQ